MQLAFCLPARFDISAVGLAGKKGCRGEALCKVTNWAWRRKPSLVHSANFISASIPGQPDVVGNFFGWDALAPIT
jgi:hypothetical protein